MRRESTECSWRTSRPCDPDDEDGDTSSSARSCKHHTVLGNIEYRMGLPSAIDLLEESASVDDGLAPTKLVLVVAGEPENSTGGRRYWPKGRVKALRCLSRRCTPDAIRLTVAITLVQPTGCIRFAQSSFATALFCRHSLKPLALLASELHSTTCASATRLSRLAPAK